MATIYLDPTAMDATAGVIGNHAQQLQALTSTMESACSAAVPVTLAGWLAEELRGIAVQAQLVALLYTAAALDTALRAQQIQTDQSLVAAQPELVSTSVDLGAVLAADGSTIGGPSTSVDIVDPSGASVDLGAVLTAAASTIGGSSTSVDIVDPSGSSVDLGAVLVRAGETGGGTPTLANNGLLAMAVRLSNTNPELSAQAAAISGGLFDPLLFQSSRNLNSRPGADYIAPNLFEGSGGRTGHTIYLKPDGEFDV